MVPLVPVKSCPFLSSSTAHDHLAMLMPGVGVGDVRNKWLTGSAESHVGKMRWRCRKNLEVPSVLLGL